MNTLIIGNQSQDKRRQAIIRVVKTGKPEYAARLDFLKLEDAWKLLSDKRRGIMNAMAGAGSLTIREISRRVRRNVRAVHSDVQALHRAGVIDKTDDGKLILPYGTIKFDFTLDVSGAA